MKQLGAFLLGGIGVFASYNISAQSLEELALLFSRNRPAGSARILGMGGVQNSLGGDFSSTASNPAGIGMYNRSELTISPTLQVAIASSGYWGDTINASKTKVSIPSFSYVHHFKEREGALVRGTFALSMTRLNDFNSKVKYQGINHDNSIGDYFAIDSDGINPDDFNGSQYNSLNRLAYNIYFIDTLKYNNYLYYISPVGINFFDNTDVPRSFQTETIETSGKQNQWTFSYGGNIKDRIFFGASLHIRNINYSNRKTFTENSYFFEKAPTYNPLNEFTLEETLRVSGTGISGTIGIIGRPFDGLQIGVSYNIPTTYYLREGYTAYMSTDWRNFDYYGDGSVVLNGLYDDRIDELINEYKLKTPGKVSTGATFFFKKAGFVSADVDIINYGSAKYYARNSGDSYLYENQSIDTTYKNLVNVRIGGEFRIKNMRLRSGFGIQPNPYRTKKNDIPNSILTPSIGAGYRSKKFYADVALVFRLARDSYNPYTVYGYSVEPKVSIYSFSPSLNFTIGFPF